MKKILLVLVLTILTSCSRSADELINETPSTSANYFVKYKVNGTLNEEAFTSVSLVGNKIEQYVSASNPTIKGSTIVLKSDYYAQNALRFSDYNDNPVKSQYYFNYGNFTTTPGMTNFVFKYVDNGTKYTYGGFVNNSNDDSTFTMNISSVSNNIAVGTFSGKINAWTGADGSSGTKKVFTITEGSFKLPIINSTY